MEMVQESGYGAARDLGFGGESVDLAEITQGCCGMGEERRATDKALGEPTRNRKEENSAAETEIGQPMNG
jgi:hypothetical protein